MEHREWRGSEYETGFRGKRIAIAGHSHHSDEADHAQLTVDLMPQVVNDTANIQFFRSIATYFGCDNPDDFWPYVVFFNFLPTIVGSEDDRYGYGTKEQLAAGRARVLRILDEHEPDMLFVFSAKSWKEFPPTLQDQELRPHDEANSWHQYLTSSGHEVRAVGLRHPQWAKTDDMRHRVERLLAS